MNCPALNKETQYPIEVEQIYYGPVLEFTVLVSSVVDIKEHIRSLRTQHACELHITDLSLRVVDKVINSLIRL